MRKSSKRGSIYQYIDFGGVFVVPVFELVTGRDPLLSVSLALDEKIFCESNAMVMNDGGVSVEGVVRGGILSSLVRSLTSDESFFMQEVKGKRAGSKGQIMLAPQMPGDIELLKVGQEQYVINQSCFLACDEGVTITNRMNSITSGLLGDTGGFVIMQTEGTGTLAVSGFGQIFTVLVEPGEEIMIDNGHLIAWDASLTHKVATASSRKGIFGRMLSTAMSGEYLVLKFSGRGKILVGSRNQLAFDAYIRSLQEP